MTFEVNSCTSYFSPKIWCHILFWDQMLSTANAALTSQVYPFSMFCLELYEIRNSELQVSYSVVGSIPGFTEI